MEVLNLISEKGGLFLAFLSKQTINTAFLFIIIFPLSFLLTKKSSYWRFCLWMLILIRLVLPTDLRLPVNTHVLVKEIPIMESITEPEGYDYYQSHETNYRFNAVLLLSLCWVSGFLLMMWILIKKSRKFKRIIKNSTTVHDNGLDDFVDKWKRYLKINRKVSIVSSDEFLSPFTTGFLNPVIYIPMGFLGSAGSGAIHSVIAHEMVHIKRNDTLKIKVQNILQIIYFFNPLVWYANKQISLAREEICDSTVLASGILSPLVYGNSILKALTFNLFGAENDGFMPGFGNYKKSYSRRIQNIMKEDSMKTRKKLLIATTVCVLGFIILPVANYVNASEGKRENTAGINKFTIVLPVSGKRISSLFGWRMNPITKADDFHNGIDIVAPEGTPIIAVADGFVVKAGWEDNGYGNLIILQHQNGYSSAYAKCRKIMVKEGQNVKAGDVIAECGMTGQATGNHLHFEIRKDGKQIDPYPYLPQEIPVWSRDRDEMKKK